MLFPKEEEDEERVLLPDTDEELRDGELLRAEDEIPLLLRVVLVELIVPDELREVERPDDEFTADDDERFDPERTVLPADELLRPAVVPEDRSEELLPELREAVVSLDERVDELRTDEEALRPLLATEER